MLPAPSKNEKKFFNENGYVLLKNVINKNKLKKIKEEVYKLYYYESKKNSNYVYKFDKSGKTKRIWNLINKSKIFRDLIQNKRINGFMEWIFERKTTHQKYFLSSFQANILQPGSKKQKLHVDTPVPEPLPRWTIKANSIWVIDEFNEFNGSTEVVPRSHKKLFKPKFKDNNNNKIKKIIAQSGSVIITHGTLWHRAGKNISYNDRIALLGSFAASYAREISDEEDQSKIIDSYTLKKSSNFLKKILGHGHGVKIGSQVKLKKRY